MIWKLVSGPKEKACYVLFLLLNIIYQFKSTYFYYTLFIEFHIYEK